MSITPSLRKYESKFETIAGYLEHGIYDLAEFAKRVGNRSGQKSTELDYIKEELLPIIEDSKAQFNDMMEFADQLLEKVNNEFEECLAKLQRRERKIKKLNLNLAEIETELERKEDDVREEEKRIEKKKKELSNAEKTLTTAEEKEADAKTKQNAAVIGGFATAVGCAIVTPFFPPAAIGVVAGAATELSGIFLMEQATQECRDIVKTSKAEVSDSKQALKKAQESKDQTKKQLSALKDEEEEAEDEISDTKREIKKWKRFRNGIIEINECTKRLYKELDQFCGRVSVLCLETNGCYDINCLKSPTLAVCNSLSKLLNCEAIQDACSDFNLYIMMSNLNLIENAKWPAIEYDQYDDLV